MSALIAPRHTANSGGWTRSCGFFTLADNTVTVPAGGTASVDLTVNTKLGGSLDGAYSAYVVAKGGGQTVRTAAAVNREVESYTVTLKQIDRDGTAAENYLTDLTGVSGLAKDKWFSPYDASGAVKIRLPKGRYVLNSAVIQDPDDFTKGADWLARPKLNVVRNTTVTLDARKAKPVKITVPDGGAKPLFASADYTVDVGDNSYGFAWWLDSYHNFRTAHLGPEITNGSLYQQWDTHWTKGAKTHRDRLSAARRRFPLRRAVRVCAGAYD